MNEISPNEDLQWKDAEPIELNQAMKHMGVSGSDNEGWDGPVTIQSSEDQFQRLLGTDLPKEKFENEYWEKKPIMIHHDSKVSKYTKNIHKIVSPRLCV